ncbi:hypothetical protein GCM10010968_00500 [Agrococcus terreus]|uniref:Uncharacterized protein n=1 Tax=Agrococcus terreus TaxID=574649 RepID=A0ABQ2K9E0_9MICO|nr:hypothetical protein GCM10010968_00500 [Agrococcus terreus]
MPPDEHGERAIVAVLRALREEGVGRCVECGAHLAPTVAIEPIHSPGLPLKDSRTEDPCDGSVTNAERMTSQS